MHPKTTFIPIGSSIKFCMVAHGKATVYPRLGTTMEWDTAAGDAICRSVGITTLQMDTKQPLVYNKNDLRNPHFIVGF